MNAQHIEEVEKQMQGIPMISEYFGNLALHASNKTYLLGEPAMDVAANLATSREFMRLSRRFARV